MVRVPPLRSPRAFPPPLGGRIRMEPLESKLLANNPLGDPSTRTVAVYTPPSGHSEGKPLLLYLPGFTGAGWQQMQRPGYLSEGLVHQLERLIRTGACDEAVLVAPDCVSALGGSQYVNSSAVGRYEDYVVQEVLPWAKSALGTAGTGVLGQSSGGFGALHLALRHPGLFEAVGVSAGDLAFDPTYTVDIPDAVRTYRAHGGPEGFLEKLFEDPSLLKGPHDPSGAALSMLCMAACYSPRTDDPEAFDLPFDPETGAIVPEVFAKWLAFDPLVRVATDEGAAALKRPKLVHVTASTPDEWSLDLGARRFAQAANAKGVPVLHQEFAGGHFQSAPRFEALFTRMLAALRKG